MKRLLSVLSALCLLAGLLPAIPLKAEAAPEPKAGVSVWTDHAASSFAGGDGTYSNPYQIANGSQLALLARNVNSGERYDNSYFELIADINLSAYPWFPIGTTEDVPFLGVFEGNGYTISGLKLSSSSASLGCVGLFGYAYGGIRNFNMTDVSIDVSGVNYVGTVVGVGGSCSNIKVSGEIAVTNCSSVRCGGIIGITQIRDYYASSIYYVTYGSATECSFDGSISISKGGDLSVGGIIGLDNADNYSQLYKLRSSGSITVTNSDSVDAGGITGWSERGIKNSYSTISIQVNGGKGYAGGLIGHSKGKLNNCYATGTVSLTASTADDANSAGGLVGRWYSGNISNCYTQNPSVACTMTNATAQTYAGKLVGYNATDSSTGTLPVVTASYVTAETTLKRNGFQDGGDCDEDSYPVVTSAHSTYSAPETGTFTYSASFITNTLGWDTTVWSVSGASPTLAIEKLCSLTIRYIDQDGVTFDVAYSTKAPGTQYSITSPARSGQTPDLAVAEGTITQNTYITVRYSHTHKPGSAATCTTPQLCTYCNQVLVEPLPHNYKLESVTDPQCTANGYTYYRCTACKKYLKDDYTAPLGHDLDENNVCIRCEKAFNGPLIDHRVHVLDQETGEPLKGASVTLGEITIQTDAQGIAPHQLIEGEVIPFKIIADGYPEHSVSSFTPGELPDTYIYLTSKSTGIYEARCNSKDVLLGVAQINAFAPGLTAEIVVKGRAKANITSYDLLQGDAIIASSTDGIFKVKNANFRTKEPIYIRMHTDGASGNNLFSQRVNINVVSFSLSADTDWGKLLPFSAGAELSFPGGTPVLEGLNFKIPSYANGKNGYVQVHIGNEKLMITFGSKKDPSSDGSDLDNKSKSQILKKMRDDWVKQNSFSAWPEGDKETEVKASFALVVEFSDAGVTSAYGQANVAYNLSFENGKTFLVWVIPVHARISTDIGGELQVSDIGYDFEKAEVLIPDFQLSVHGQITLYEGIGCSVISAGVYGTAGASLTFGVEDLREYMTYRLYGELGLYARLKLFFWKAMEYRLPLLQGEFSGGAGSYARRAMYTLEGYEAVSRDYLKNRSQWLSKVPRNGAVPENATMQTSSYTAIDPKVVVCGDTVMMVFADDDGTEGLNYQHLYYSLYQTDTGVWSKPQRVDDNNLCDLEYEVCTDGSNIWIVYTQMEAVTQENQDALEGLLSTVEVTAATYNFEQSCFTDHTVLTDDDSFDTLPQLAMTSEGLRAVWVSNVTNDVFSQNANNRLYTAVYADGNWSQPTALTREGSTVVSMDLGLLNDKAYIATVRDVDCDLATAEDHILVLMDEGGNTITVPTEKNTNDFVQFAQLAGKQQLLWYSESNLYSISTPTASPEALFNQPVEGLNDGYRVVSLNETEAVILFTNQLRSAEGESSGNLYLLYGNNGQWNSNGIPLTQPEADRYIEGYDACVLNGKLLIPHISVHATVTDSQIQRVADFRSSYTALPQDLSVGEAVFLPSQLVEGSELEVKVPVTNQSLKLLEQVSYQVTDRDSTLQLEGSSPLSVAAGETGWLSINLPRSVLKANNGCCITVSAEDRTEDNLSNNSTELALWYADLSVTASQLLLSGQQIHYAVTNEGNTAAQGTLEILLKEADGTETSLQTVNLPTMEPGKDYSGALDVDQALCDSSRVVLLRVCTEQQELYDFNNETSVTLYPVVRESTTSLPSIVTYGAPVITTPHVVYDLYKGGTASFSILENGWKMKGFNTTIPITTYLYTDGGMSSPSIVKLNQSDLKGLSVGYYDLVMKYWNGELYTEISAVLEVIDTTPLPATIYAEDQTVFMADRPLVLGRDIRYQVDSQGTVTASYAPVNTENWQAGLPPQVGMYQMRLSVAADRQTGYSASECTFTLEIQKGTRANSLPQVTALPDGSYRFDQAVPTAGASDGRISYGYSTVNDPTTVTQWSVTGLIPAQDTSVIYYLFARVTDGVNFEDAYSLGYPLNIHIHTYEATVYAPTCVTEGYTKHICSICQESYVDSQVSALGHSFTTYVSDNNATCTANGTKTAVCDRCDATDTQVLEGTATGHQYDSGVVLREATCTEDGKLLFTCHCGDKYTDLLPAYGHQYSTTVIPPTCEAEGYSSHSCERCGDSYNDSITAPTGHSYDAGVITAKPNCANDGVMTFTCSCGHQYTTVLPATGHEYVPGGSVPPQCELSGFTSIGCIHCGDVETTEIPPTGHSYSSTATPPTCLEAGCITNVCDSCGKTEILPGELPLGHSFTDYHLDGNATCTEDGTKTAQCDRCDMTDTIVDPGSSYGHRYKDSILTPADCIHRGTILYRCENCDDQYEVVIAALGHRYEDIITAPSCEKTGYTTHTCTVCGDTFKDGITPATGHHYADGFCQDCGILQPGYAIYGGFVESYGDAYEPITIELIPEGSSTVAYTTILNNYSTSYTFSGIPAGNYTLVIHKKNHVSRYFAVSISAGNSGAVQPKRICLLGDVTGEGKVNVGDVARLYGHIRKTNPIADEYSISCADVTGDGRLNVGDTATLYSHVKNTKKLY